LKRCALLTAALVAAIGVSEAQGAVLYSWENEPGGFSNAPTGYSSTIGVTHGSYSAYREVPGTGGWTSWTDGNAYDEIEIMKSNNRVSVDVTLPDTYTFPVAGSGVNVWFNFNIASSLDNPDFGGSAGINLNAADPTVEGSGLIRITAPGTYTLSWDYDPARFANVVPGVPASWAEIRIVTNATPSGNFPAGHTIPLYFDNFQAVPEPASLSLLGVGALGLLARRRRP
jgi:hypothetical protein